jgi:hypothetical protein
MKKRVKVEFSEIALKGLEKLFPDVERRQGAFHSIGWFVKRDDTVHKSTLCDAFDDLDLYVFPLSNMRILFESNGIVRVWSILKEIPDLS